MSDFGFRPSFGRRISGFGFGHLRSRVGGTVQIRPPALGGLLGRACAVRWATLIWMPVSAESPSREETSDRLARRAFFGFVLTFILSRVVRHSPGAHLRRVWDVAAPG